MQGSHLRATKLLTVGQLVILPNSLMSKDAILNFSEPVIARHRASKSKRGASYDAPPNLVNRRLAKRSINAPMKGARDPAPDVVMVDFAASPDHLPRAVLIDDFGPRRARQVTRCARTSAHVQARLGIEIPFPYRCNTSARTRRRNVRSCGGAG